MKHNIYNSKYINSLFLSPSFNVKYNSIYNDNLAVSKRYPCSFLFKQKVTIDIE